MCERKKLASISPLHLRGEEVNASKPLKLHAGHDSEDRDLGVFESHDKTRKRTRGSHESVIDTHNSVAVSSFASHTSSMSQTGSGSAVRGCCEVESQNEGGQRDEMDRRWMCSRSLK